MVETRRFKSRNHVHVLIKVPNSLNAFGFRVIVSIQFNLIYSLTPLSYDGT